MQVGFIGLGRMGHAMARRVMAGGHDLVVFNRDATKTSGLVAEGARAALSIADACSEREVVISMLADDRALQSVSLCAGGLRDRLPAGAVHLVMGTHGVGAIQALVEAHANAGQVLVAAPVLGRPEAAAAGQLGIVAAGPAESVGKCDPLFRCIGRRVFQAGERPEGATATKLANNFLLGCAIEAMGEAYALVGKHGVPPQVLYDVMTEGLFSAAAYKVYGKIIADQAYDDIGFTTLLGLKDVDLVLAAAGAAQVPMPSANTLRESLLRAVAHGHGDRDWAVIAQEQARASGLQ